jgi:hypothetical protein
MNPALATAFLTEIEHLTADLPDPAVDPQEMYFVVQQVIDHPGWHIKDVLDAFERDYKRKIDLQVQRFLQRESLWRRDERQAFRQTLARLIPPVLRLFSLTTPPLSQSDYRALRVEASGRMLSFMLIVSVTTHLEGGTDETERGVARALKRFLRKSSREAPSRLLEHLFDICAEFYQFERRSALDTLRDLNSKAAELAHAPRAADDNNGETETAEVAAVTLAQENVDLRAALIGLQHELTRLGVEIEKQQEQAENKAIYALFSQMNHVSHGYLLDRLIQTAVDLDVRFNDGWQPDITAESAVYLIPALKEFFIQLGLTPLRAIGERVTITMDDLAQIQYLGSEFHDRAEHKRVEFRTSGWGYGGRVLSRPEAIEVETI